MVRVMARGTLIDFVANRVSPAQQAVVTKHLDAWYKTVWKAQWKSSAELKEQVSSASVLTSERVVFNIKGNDYRLIALRMERQKTKNWMSSQRLWMRMRRSTS